MEFQVGQEFIVLEKYHGRIVEIRNNGISDRIYVTYGGSQEHHRLADGTPDIDPYSYGADELEKLIALKAGDYLVIPVQFCNPDRDGWCVECHMPTNGICGHFMDARDFYGPLERINWMGGSFPREAYGQWVSEHFQEIRYVQENPNFLNVYPDGSSGTIPYLANLAAKLDKGGEGK